MSRMPGQILEMRATFSSTQRTIDYLRIRSIDRSPVGLGKPAIVLPGAGDGRDSRTSLRPRAADGGIPGESRERSPSCAEVVGLRQRRQNSANSPKRGRLAPPTFHRIVGVGCVRREFPLPVSATGGSAPPRGVTRLASTAGDHPDSKLAEPVMQRALGRRSTRRSTSRCLRPRLDPLRRPGSFHADAAACSRPSRSAT